jgi:phenylpyruvate tautomerase PptA (4-oxalocrotonate tautomerase family)
MPLVTATVQKPKSRAFKDAVLAGVHRALVASGVPEADRFQRVIELDAEGLRFDPRYPDLEAPRDANYTLIEILWSVGRSVKIKRKVVADIVANLAREPGLDAGQVMVVFVETSWENWSFGGGRLLHA